MELGFDNRQDAVYDAYEARFSGLMETAFELLGINTNYEVDVSLVDDTTIHQINRDYRKVDRVTDVISFAFEDDEEPTHQIHGEGIPQMLGEIFISIPQALRQAKEIGNSEEREISFLFVHGLLHLLGYDHMKPKDEAIMFPLQEKILSTYKKEAK